MSVAKSELLEQIISEVQRVRLLRPAIVKTVGHRPEIDREIVVDTSVEIGVVEAHAGVDQRDKGGASIVRHRGPRSDPLQVPERIVALIARSRGPLPWRPSAF